MEKTEKEKPVAEKPQAEPAAAPQAPIEQDAAQAAAKHMDVLQRIEKTIAKIRPYIQADGGDVQLVDYQDGVVTVRMSGACAGCMSIDATLTDGIQAILIDEVPEVTAVKLDSTPIPYSYY